ncbi:NAD(P)/FAD-dependent oxidoreductase [Streptomyces monticola]|uniref:NAD(P)/FAD-dependent oxidoreductase n=1 Tax=Streptomyces monticola TaxID=2666263 RepID=A0ABW2JTN6_9ACTN
MTQTGSTDLTVVGAGPAGVAATLMAVSVGMSVRLVEQGVPGGKLHHIGALDNVPGDWHSGPDLAAALSSDLDRARATQLLYRTTGRATAVAGYDGHAEVTLADGTVHRSEAVVVATGVTTLSAAAAPWIEAPDGFSPSPLWRTDPAALRGPTWILGADRPLGTWLRAHPHVEHTLNVACPPGDDYKSVEVEGDPRVHLVRCAALAVAPAPSGGAGLQLTVRGRDGRESLHVAGTVLHNLGSRPATLDGLAQGPDGYCPPELQHPRILTAGDLRSARFQRVVTAQGSGAQAALARYYDIALTGD